MRVKFRPIFHSQYAPWPGTELQCLNNDLFLFAFLHVRTF